MRFFSTLAMAIAMLLAGLMARHEFGGRRWAQVAASVAVGVAPFPMMGGGLFSYSSFDFLWWALIAYLMARLLKSEDAALVAGNRRGHRGWLDDQVHPGLPGSRPGRRGDSPPPAVI